LFITALALENPLEPLEEELGGTGLTWKILDGVRISLESLIGGVGRSSFVAERLPPFEDPPEPQEPEAICIAWTAEAPKDVSLAYFLNCLLVLINLSGRAEAGTLLCWSTGGVISNLNGGLEFPPFKGVVSLVSPGAMFKEVQLPSPSSSLICLSLSFNN